MNKNRKQVSERDCYVLEAFLYVDGKLTRKYLSEEYLKHLHEPDVPYKEILTPHPELAATWEEAQWGKEQMELVENAVPDVMSTAVRKVRKRVEFIYS